MKNYKKLIKFLMLSAGIIELIFAFSHFVFPELTLKSGGFLQLQSNELDFIKLSMIGLGINLLVFGTLTIICSVKYEVLNRIPLYLAIAQAIKYLIRIGAEFLFPVSVPILFIKQPFIPVLCSLLLIWILHLSVVILIFKDKKTI